MIAIVLEKTISHTEDVDDTDERRALANTAARYIDSDFKIVSINGKPVLGTCVSCGTVLIDDDWAVKDGEGKVYCGGCFDSDTEASEH